MLPNDELQALIEVLARGGVIACPTETQMGLLADALDPAAVARVSAMKSRPASEALSVLVPSIEVAQQLVREVPAQAWSLARAHWPGPLTLVLRARDGLPAALLKDGKLALRVPGPSPALDLVSAWGRPLTATSANKRGEPPCSNAAELKATFGTALDAVASGTPPGALPSTIVELTGNRPIILRQGAIAIPDADSSA